MRYRPHRNLIEICVCGHGKVHHNGKYAECTCDIKYYKNQKLCLCSNFKLDLQNPINQRIMAWNNSFTKSQEKQE